MGVTCGLIIISSIFLLHFLLQDNFHYASKYHYINNVDMEINLENDPKT